MSGQIKVLPYLSEKWTPLNRIPIKKVITPLEAKLTCTAQEIGCTAYFT